MRYDRIRALGQKASVQRLTHLEQYVADLELPPRAVGRLHEPAQISNTTSVQQPATFHPARVPSGLTGKASGHPCARIHEIVGRLLLILHSCAPGERACIREPEPELRLAGQHIHCGHQSRICSQYWAHQLPDRHVTNWVCGHECQSWKLPTGSSENTAYDTARRAVCIVHPARQKLRCACGVSSGGNSSALI